MQTKGIILAGGHGTRLRPLTNGVSKQLLAVFDKPLIYYPLATLMNIGIRDIFVVVDPLHLDGFVRLLGDGSQWGISLTYGLQRLPAGVPDGLIVGEEFLGGNPCVLILGDTILHGRSLEKFLRGFSASTGATSSRVWVEDPSRFGVIEIDSNGEIVSIEEKPMAPKSNFAIPGLYFLDGSASSRARLLKPSPRGELEITDLLLSYHKDGLLQTTSLPKGVTWIDIGSIEGLFSASEFVKHTQISSKKLIGSPALAAFSQGWITLEQLGELDLNPTVVDV